MILARSCYTCDSLGITCDLCIALDMDELMDEIEEQTKIDSGCEITAEQIEVVPGLDVSSNERYLNLYFTSPDDPNDTVIMSLDFEAARKLFSEGLGAAKLLWGEGSEGWAHE